MKAALIFVILALFAFQVNAAPQAKECIKDDQCPDGKICCWVNGNHEIPGKCVFPQRCRILGQVNIDEVKKKPSRRMQTMLI